MWEPDRPLVSIVTPSFNAARFLTETIESVLAQDYPQIEYIVMDGGSSDETIDILRGYGNRITWVSERDRGAADAINRGFAASHGEIFSYLGADDLYLPGAISTAVRALERHPEASGIYGDGIWIDETGERIGPYPVRDYDPALLAHQCFVCQPASFLRHEAFENVGGLDPDLQLTFDYEFWMRLARVHSMHRVEQNLALSRMHRSNKSLGQRAGVYRETFRILQRHYGYVPFDWIYSYLSNRADGRDQFFEPLEPSMLRYLQSLPVGLWMNRTSAAKYLAEWFRVMSWAGLRRRLAG